MYYVLFMLKHPLSAICTKALLSMTLTTFCLLSFHGRAAPTDIPSLPLLCPILSLSSDIIANDWKCQSSIPQPDVHAIQPTWLFYLSLALPFLPVMHTKSQLTLTPLALLTPKCKTPLALLTPKCKTPLALLTPQASFSFLYAPEMLSNNPRDFELDPELSLSRPKLSLSLSLTRNLRDKCGE
ncbi:hypothetical protein L1987_78404 [Smallanthus sonchifolius]|uniref:Uncharacterized protein n=1 Tax=Smallanthus sonchifolius TaxID=185202 RepID=A0ACB8ZBN0_9ASTR|nr:hypothetical protein L1987_78404 [Smallanthus sonchifolius]